jgi:isopentenyl diphosphate isomerase/L-lactate dehydrogenase-like FMN-dependent dehydrogenase
VASQWSKLPIIVKGILNGEDAEAAVKNGASAIIVSNHGGRAYDGAVPTLMALPECVDAVGGKIPVFMDGGIRRGVDIVKALALGAKGVFVGRAHCWGLMAFGSVGVQRVVELLHAELTVAMGLVGAPTSPPSTAAWSVAVGTIGNWAPFPFPFPFYPPTAQSPTATVRRRGCA